MFSYLYFYPFFRVRQFLGICCVAKTSKQMTISSDFDALHLPKTWRMNNAG